MHSPPSAIRDSRSLVLCVAFFASGASALAFETLWFHQAGLVFGNSVWASALVLSGFMAGMALGNLLAARRQGDARAALRLYAVLELVIGLTGVGLVHALPASAALIASLLSRLGESSPVPLQAVRLLLAFVLLVVPSTAMGMTLPLLVAAVRRGHGNFGRALGLLYGTNTAGAVLGVLGVEMLLLPAFGIRGSGWLAAGLNGLAAVASWVLLMRAAEPAAAETPAEPEEARATRVPIGFSARWLLAAFGAGFALLALEVVWLRFAMLFINDTPLAFAVMLSTVLAGIAAGGFVAALWSSRSDRASDFVAPVAYGAGALVIAGYLLYPEFLRNFYLPDQSVGTVALLTLPLVFPTSLASGVLFSLLGTGLFRRGYSDARAAGSLAFANTLGAGLGSFCGGFWLLPRFGMERSLLALIALYGMIGLVLGMGRELGALLRIGAPVLFAGALALFPYGKMASTYVRTSAGHWMTKYDSLAEVREGLTATIMHVVHKAHGLALFDQLATNAYSMTTNDYGSRRYMKLYVLLPRAIHPRIENALVVGFGIGNTAEAMIRSPEILSIDVADISPDILALSRNMQTRKQHPLDDPRVHVHIEDGRQYLLGTSKRFDLITGEPPPPVIAGVVNLYTREYFELIRERLRDGGIATYWLPLMNLTAPSAKSIVRGFCDAFDDCSLWHGTDRNFMLMGTRQAKLRVDDEQFARDFRDPELREELDSIGFESPGQLGALFVGDAAYLRDLVKHAEPLTDDRPKRLHQAGSREDRDALIWQWRDTTASRQRFTSSELIARLWPAGMRQESLRHFETQRLLNDLMFPSQTATPARQTRVLHQVLHGTPLRFPALLLLKSDPDIQRALASAPREVLERPEWLRHRLAGALASRDFSGALALVDQMTDEQLVMPDLREYVRYVVTRHGTQANAGVAQ
jgi:spermidine synthase